MKVLVIKRQVVLAQVQKPPLPSVSQHSLINVVTWGSQLRERLQHRRPRRDSTTRPVMAIELKAPLDETQTRSEPRVYSERPIKVAFLIYERVLEWP